MAHASDGCLLQILLEHQVACVQLMAEPPDYSAEASDD
jgi:hypothetical protein